MPPYEDLSGQDQEMESRLVQDQQYPAEEMMISLLVKTYLDRFRMSRQEQVSLESCLGIMFPKLSLLLPLSFLLPFQPPVFCFSLVSLFFLLIRLYFLFIVFTSMYFRPDKRHGQ